MKTTLTACANALATGATTSRALVEQCLANVAAGEGGRVFTRIWEKQALAAAAEQDRLRKQGAVRSPLAGLPVSIKDLFDVAGETTLAGSIVLTDAPPASVDAPVVRRLKSAEMVLIGRTNMSEFAFSSVGLNPHYGTPGNPWDRSRVPGGSSSGAAVSVADGMALGAIGSDTGGSIRTPAALCGIVGFKPTKARVPTAGAIPLSTTLDTIGPLANCVADCALLDSVIADTPLTRNEALDVRGVRFGVPRDVVLDDLEEPVARAFGHALTCLSRAGAVITESRWPLLLDVEHANQSGGFSPPEAFTWHEALLGRRGDRYDPRARARFESGSAMSVSEYIRLCWRREALMSRARSEGAAYDAMLMPTCPIVAPPIAEVDADDAMFWKCFTRLARNTKLINFLDWCAITLPIQRPGEAPVGLMIASPGNTDETLLALARGVEDVLRAIRE